MKKQIKNLCSLFLAVLTLFSITALCAKPQAKAPYIVATGEAQKGPYGQFPFYVSKNGVAWNTYYLPPADVFSKVTAVLWANDRYLAILYTTSGVPNTERACAIISYDGVHWSERYPASFQNQMINHVAWANNLYVGVGDEYYGHSFVTTSPDGIHWARANFPSIGTLKRVIWANNQFVAVGDQAAIMTSSDGKNWTREDSTVPSADITGIAWGNNIYVASCKEHSLERPGTYVITSPDGKHWTKRVIDPTTEELTNITWGNNQFVAISWNRYFTGYNNVYISKDGINWTKYNSGFYIFGGMTDLIWLDNQYITISTQSTIKTSPNGIDWTTRYPKETADTLLSITG